jgi:predicted trehalose synthase
VTPVVSIATVAVLSRKNRVPDDQDVDEVYGFSTAVRSIGTAARAVDAALADCSVSVSCSSEAAADFGFPCSAQ